MSYLRLKNITLGYTIPTEVLSRVHLSRARVYVALENFLTFDNLRGLPIDPEAIAGNVNWNRDVITGENLGNTANSDRTGMTAPMFKNISVGLQITL
jgi:hypothetical protein